MHDAVMLRGGSSLGEYSLKVHSKSNPYHNPNSIPYRYVAQWPSCYGTRFVINIQQVVGSNPSRRATLGKLHTLMCLSQSQAVMLGGWRGKCSVMESNGSLRRVYGLTLPYYNSILTLNACDWVS